MSRFSLIWRFLPNLFPTSKRGWEVLAVVFVDVSQPSQPSQPFLSRVYTRACLINIGWEGWEGWEDDCLSSSWSSQPSFEVGKRLGSAFDLEDAMDAVIAKMRADWAVVSVARREAGEWTAQDESEIGDAIKASIAAKDAVMVACWSRWLADLSAWVVAWNLVCRGSERRMREAAKAHREQGAVTAGDQAGKGSK